MDAAEHGPATHGPATYIEALVARLAAGGAAPVIRCMGVDVTAAELLASIHRYARALASIRIGRGSLVALFAPNRPEALAVRYAANLLGAASVFLSAPVDEDRRAALLAQMDPSLLVVFPGTAALIPSGTTVPVAAVGVAVEGAVQLDDLAAAQSAAPVACSARPEDPGIIVSSGGTTGVPHGSWRSFAAYTTMACVPSPADRRQLVNGRLAYLSQVLVDTTLLGGGCVVLRDRYDAADTLATIERERITDLFLVEPQLFEMMDHPDVDRRDLSSLRQVVHVGASAPPVLRMRARARLGPVVAHTYGASEMGLVSMLPPAGHDPAQPQSFSSAGRILPGVALRLRRTDGGEAAVGEVGMVEVRSAAMASGYRNRPDEEAAAFVEGWFRSGDLGLLDSTGCLHILGRAADMISADGKALGPVMLEETLCRLPDVRYAVLVAEPEAGRWIAAVEAWPDRPVDPAACRRALIDTHGAGIAVSILPVPAGRLPLTEQGKPDRPAIRRLAH